MSGRPLQFPRPGRLLLWSLLFVFLAPILVGIPSALWLRTMLDPVAAYYLGPYVTSWLEGGTRGAMVGVRYAEKTAAPGKTSDLLPGDAVPGNGQKPLGLSPGAMAQGWQRVVIRPRIKVRAAALEAYLRDAVYGGEPAWSVLLRPGLYELAAILAVCTAWIFLRSGKRGDRGQEQRHGRRNKGPELVAGVGLGWNRFRRREEDGIALRLAGRGIAPGGSFRIPKRLESSHILLLGDTGSGKSSAIRQMLRQVEQSGESAIVYDPAMDFVGEFYSPERGDLILNPLDARCPWWDLRGEVTGPEVATTIAAAMLPEKEYEKEFFTTAPRRVLARLLLRKPHVRELLAWMCAPEKIAERVKGTPQAALIDPGAPAQRAGVLSSLNLIADSLELLPPPNGKPGFRIAEWKFQRTRWVFLTSSSAYREKLLPLHSVWLDLFILRMMEPCMNEAKPVWFVIDELASLNKLPQLHAAVTENRKYRNPVILGLQGKSQMEKRYGQDAEAMLSQPATKIFLKTSEPRAAKWVSEAIGEVEVERLKKSRSMHMLGSRQSFAMEIATKPLVMPSEIAGLAPLHGFIKQENRVLPVHFELATKRGRHPEFVARKSEEAVGTTAVAGPPASPAVKPDIVLATERKGSQAELPGTEEPNIRREGFSWDSSSEIQ